MSSPRRHYGQPHAPPNRRSSLQGNHPDYYQQAGRANAPQTSNHFGQNSFPPLNYPELQGRLMAGPSDYRQNFEMVDISRSHGSSGAGPSNYRNNNHFEQPHFADPAEGYAFGPPNYRRDNPQTQWNHAEPSRAAEPLNYHAVNPQWNFTHDMPSHAYYINGQDVNRNDALQFPGYNLSNQHPHLSPAVPQPGPRQQQAYLPPNHIHQANYSPNGQQSNGFSEHNLTTLMSVGRNPPPSHLPNAQPQQHMEPAPNPHTPFLPLRGSSEKAFTHSSYPPAYHANPTPSQNPKLSAEEFYGGATQQMQQGNNILKLPVRERNRSIPSVSGTLVGPQTRGPSMVQALPHTENVPQLQDSRNRAGIQSLLNPQNAESESENRIVPVFVGKAEVAPSSHAGTGNDTCAVNNSAPTQGQNVRHVDRRGEDGDQSRLHRGGDEMRTDNRTLIGSKKEGKTPVSRDVVGRLRVRDGLGPVSSHGQVESRNDKMQISTMLDKESKEEEIADGIRCDCGCGGLFANTESLNSHKARDHRKEPGQYVCSQCRSRFRTKQSRNVHQMTHQGEKVCECNQCAAPFNSRMALAHHLKATICGKASRGSSSTAGSATIKGKEKKGISKENKSRLPEAYRCKICNFISKWRGNLIRHIDITHKKIKPFGCEFCNKFFPTKGNLKTHYLNCKSKIERERGGGDSGGNGSIES